jgi:hypothetical protein
MIFLRISEPKWARAILSKFVLSILFIVAASASDAAVLTKKTAAPSANRALNLVTFFDLREGQVFNWWAENTTPGAMAKMAYSLNHFLPADRYIHPLQEKVEIPPDLKKTDLSSVEKLRLAKLFNAATIVQGDVIFLKSPLLENGTRIKIQLKAQTLRGEPTELVRIFDLNPTDIPALTLNPQNPVALAFMDLSEQTRKSMSAMDDADVELIVSGKLSYQEWEKFKSLLQRNIRGIRKLQEVAYENEQVSLKIFYAGSSGAGSLSKALEKIQWGGFHTQVVSHDESRVFFDVKAKTRN